MAVKDKPDKNTSEKDVDLAKGDIPLNFKSGELGKFELEEKHAPYNKKLKGTPLDTSGDKYAQASRNEGP